ncbi:hypothetical protein [Streptomyces sp. ADI95-16]|uniref:hypothetical protein n=1 Tax=Streptomyces sp. ADI95-16 TaxID=1522758 RepID=UPI0013DDF235|nr:hypothetical protein [Streptomyces sp. ADI95-16]
MSVAAINNNSPESPESPEFLERPESQAFRRADRMLVDNRRFGDSRSIEERNVARFSIGAELATPGARPRRSSPWPERSARPATPRAHGPASTRRRTCCPASPHAAPRAS